MKEVVIKNAQGWGDEWYAIGMQWRPDSESAWLPTGLQTVPIADPNWVHDKDSDDWKRAHFIICIRENFKKSLAKPLDLDSKVSGVTQEKEEIHTAFLERLREALRKHTNLDPDAPNLFLKTNLLLSRLQIFRGNSKNWPLAPI